MTEINPKPLDRFVESVISPTTLFPTPEISHEVTELEQEVDAGELTNIPIQKPRKRSAVCCGKQPEVVRPALCTWGVPCNQPPKCARKSETQHRCYRPTHAHQQHGLPPQSIRQSIPMKHGHSKCDIVEGLLKLFLSPRLIRTCPYLPPKSVTKTHDQPDIIPDFALVSPNDTQPPNQLDTTISTLRSALVVDEVFSPG